FTTVADSPGVDRVSSVTRLNFLPSTPPAALRSLTARAVPLWEELPNAASLPVKDANSPTGIVSPPPPPEGLLHPVRIRPVIRANAAKTKQCLFFMPILNS